MKILLDTNVVLDLLLERSEWLADAAAIFDASRDGDLESYLGASSLTDIYYVARRQVGGEEARKRVRICLDELRVLTVDRDALEAAYALPIDDLEDALQAALVVRNRLDAIVTRDVRGFASAGVVALSPTELIARL